MSRCTFQVQYTPSIRWFGIVTLTITLHSSLQERKIYFSYFDCNLTGNRLKSRVAFQLLEALNFIGGGGVEATLF